MAVYNKELIINGQAVRSPEQQVWKNTEDIKTLQDRTRDAFRYSGTLPIDSVTCARGSIDANFGYLIDDNSSVFKFQDGDNNTLLIQYLCNIKGPEGPSGGTVPVEANPDEDATDTLNKILIGDTVYTAGGGGGDSKRYIHYIRLVGNATYAVGSQENGSMLITVESDSSLPFVKTENYVEGTNQDFVEFLAKRGCSRNDSVAWTTGDALYSNAIGGAHGVALMGIGYYYDNTDLGLRYISAFAGGTNLALQYGKWNATTLTDIKIVDTQE